MLTRFSTRKKQDGAVGAADEKQKDNGGKKQYQGTSRAMHIWLDNRLNADMEEGGKVLWRFPFELIEERLELCVCG